MTLTTDLVSYYKLDGSAGDVIDVHGDNDGTNSGATRGETGKINDAFDFDGSDHVETEDESQLRGTSGVIGGSFWINIDSVTEHEFIMGKGNSYVDSHANGWFIMLNPDGKIYVRVIDDNVNQTVTCTTDVVDGAWHHVAFQLGTSGQKIYIDGEEEGDAPSNTMVSGYGNDIKKAFSLGANYRIQSSQWEVSFDGRLDEVGVWERVLTSDEISALYNSGDGLEYPLGAKPNPPTNPNPSNSSIDVSLTTTLSVDLVDPEGDSMDASFYWDDDSLIETVEGVSSGSTATTNSLNLNYDTNYSWYVTVVDGTGSGTTTSNTWNFTTEEEPPPEPVIIGFTGTVGTAAISTEFPVKEGLTARTTKQTGKPNLEEK